MATLQIRDLPDPLHQLLQRRARRHHRSLSQQGFDPAPEELIRQDRSRREAAVLVTADKRLQQLAARVLP